MGDVVQFDDHPEADLKKPRWFYNECGTVAEAACSHYALMLNALGITFDDVWMEIEEWTPIRLMALSAGDEEIMQFIASSAVWSCWVNKIGGVQKSKSVKYDS